jgi:hypothetical protein
MTTNLSQAMSIKQQNLRHLITRRNVVGVGVGYKETSDGLTDELAVLVNVAQKIPKAQLAESDLVPKMLDGVKTDVVETGRFLAGQTDPARVETTAQTERFDPKLRCRPTVPAGVSISHADVTAGTFGCLVRRGSDLFILSNNHVLANVNSAKPGDPIIQPGRYDGGRAEDQVAVLAEFIPLDFGGKEAHSSLARKIEQLLNFAARILRASHRFMSYDTTPGENLVDAALARPLNPDQLTPDLPHIGRPRGVAQAGLGTPVQKTGRTTGYTQGRITQIDVTTQVEYNGRLATFTGQLMASGMSEGGDSGSVVLDEAKNIIGLLFAGSRQATLINPIQAVLRMLNVEIVT